MAAGIPDYDELKLRLEPGEDGAYRVRIEGPDGSTASGAFSPPFDKTQLDNFVLRVGRPRRGVRAYRSSQMEEAKRFGHELFESLLQGEVRDVYLSARRLAEVRERGLRVTLSLTGAPDLMQIPWEFLYERPSFLAQSIYTPLVRSLDLSSARPPRPLTLPLRILGMVSRPQGFETLDVDTERRKLEDALSALQAQGMVELRWLEGATLSELNRVIGAPDDVHVLHYIGHGAYDERTESGILVLEDDQGRAHEVTGEELGSLLYDEHSLRLVVLNSCEGARGSHVDPFSGVGSSLVEHRIPAVVGMQFEITDNAAITFADSLYTALAQGFPVDAALAQARRAIWAAGSDIEFGTPVLFLRTADARLFDIQPSQPLRAEQDRTGKSDLTPPVIQAPPLQPPPLQAAPPAPTAPPPPTAPTASPGKRRRLLMGIALLALISGGAVLALVSIPTAEEHDVEQAVIAYGRSTGDEACDFFTQRAIKSLGGIRKCRDSYQQYGSSTYDIKDVRVEGNTARVHLVGDETLLLALERGSWKIDSGR